MDHFLITLGLMVIFYFLFEVLSRWSVQMEEQNKRGFLPNAVAMLAAINYCLSFAVSGLIMWHDGRMEKMHKKQFLEDRQPYEDVLQHQISVLEAENEHLKQTVDSYNHCFCVRAEALLLSRITTLLPLSREQTASLADYISLFTISIQKVNILSIEDIDSFIDWIFLSAYFVPDFHQYRELGLYSVVTHRIFVPESVRLSSQDWDVVQDEATRAGLLLSRKQSDPSIDAWNKELSSFLPGLFDTEDADSNSILQRIIQLAAEGLDDDASLPEYIARLADVPHNPEHDAINDISSKLERYLKSYSEDLMIDSEEESSELRLRIKRIVRRGRRIDIVREHRKNQLLSGQY